MTRTETKLGLVREEFEIHPVANIFPMMDEEELQDLAADIQQNGLIHPIMLDQDGALVIDGRNRLAACKLANVEPIFERLPAGHDPRAYIVSQNLIRRNLSKGQQAMALAMVCPEAKRGGKREKGSSVFSEHDFSRARLSQARTVLHYSIALAQQVAKGITSLDDALEIARQYEESAKAQEANLQRLRNFAPDLANMVAEGRLTLDGAMAAFQARKATEERVRQSGRNAAASIVSHFVAAALAIQAAAKAGEQLVIPDELLDELRQTLPIFWKGQEEMRARMELWNKLPREAATEGPASQVQKVGNDSSSEKGEL
jgi:hypothetical protein